MNTKKTYMKTTLTLLIFLLFTYSIVSAQEMKGMDMNKKETKSLVQPVTYTCPILILPFLQPLELVFKIDNYDDVVVAKVFITGNN